MVAPDSSSRNHLRFIQPSFVGDLSYTIVLYTNSDLYSVCDILRLNRSKRSGVSINPFCAFVIRMFLDCLSKSMQNLNKIKGHSKKCSLIQTM